LERFGLWPQKAKQIQIYFGFKQSYESNKDNKFNYLTLQEFAAVEEKLRKIKLQRYNQWAIKNRRPKSKLAFSYPKLNPLGCKTVNSSSALVVDCNGSISKCWDDCTYDSKSISNINLGYHALKGQKEFIDMLNFNHFDYSEECASCRFLPICESGNCYHRQVEPGQVMPCTSWKFKLQSVLKEQYLCCCDNPDEIQSYEDLFR
jgi:radical SAM protein with 4Fe4S-binding SPASM domain